VPIIINGGSRRAGGWWSKHLENKATNERVEVVEIVGLSATTLPEAFREMHAVSRGTKCENYFYQANINPRADEQLTSEQWQQAVDRLEKNLGLSGQPRFVVEHEKNGRTHRHVVWSRIDTEQMRAIPDSLTAAIHERTSRELEIIFDLERGQSILVPDRDFDRPDRRPKKHETIRALDGGIDPQVVKAEVSALWHSADNAHAFKAALEASGYVLARGDRRDFVIIDRAGDDHSLARRAGVKAAALRERMKEIDPASLPSVAEARAQQRAALEAERAPTVGRNAADATVLAREGAARAPEGRPQPEAAERAGKDQPAVRGRYAGLVTPEPAPTGKTVRPLSGTAAEIRMAWSLSQTMSELEDALATHGISLAQVSPEEAYASERRAVLAKAAGHFRPAWREGEIVAVDGRSVYRLNERTTGDTRAEIEGKLAGLDRDALMNVADTKEAMRAAAWVQERADQQAKREQVRPASTIEQRIAECARVADLGTIIQQDADGNRVAGAEALADRLRPEAARETTNATVFGPEAFAQELDAAGIRVARVTATDVQALDALREAEQQTHRPRHFAELMMGDLAAITSKGAVYRISPDKIGEAVQFLPTDLPSVVEARSAMAIDREQIGEVWAQHRADATELRDQWATYREDSAAAADTARTLHQAAHDIETTIDAGERTASRFGGGIAEAVTSFLGGVFNLFFPAKLTGQDAAIAHERAEQAQINRVLEQEQAAVRDQIVEESRQKRHEREAFGEFGPPPRATDRDRGRDDDYGRERERG
jgi:hypothetical protein